MPFRDKDTDFPKHFIAETKEEAERLLKDFEYTINLLAFKYAQLTNLEEDDLRQEAFIGLARANKEFDIERSEQFKIFAIYKIKDAIHEYVASQSYDIAVPQYILGAANLISKIYKHILTFNIETDGSYHDIWDKANTFIKSDNIELFVKDDNKNLVQQVKAELNQLLESLNNYAIRARTSVKQLLAKAELMPVISEIENDLSYDDTIYKADTVENNLIDSMHKTLLIKQLRSILSEKDYNLLVDHYINGKTVRQLADEMGIKASSVTVKIKKIVEMAKDKMRKNGYV